MQSDLFSCPICYIQYDEDKHLPKVIPTCGHTLCSACITQIQKNKKCPLDRIKFLNLSKKTDKFPVNFVLLQIIKEKLENEYKICIKHNKPKKFVCTVDYMRMCAECVYNHKNHDIRDADDAQKEAQIQKKKLESVIEETKSHREEVESSLEASKQTVITILTYEFDKIRDIIEEKESEIFEKIQLAYYTRKEHLGEALEKDEILREKCELKIADLEIGRLNKRFFRTLEKLKKEGVTHPSRDIDSSIYLTEEECISAIEKLSSLLSFRIQNIYFDIPDILNDSDTNIIQVYEPPPLENLLYFKAPDRESLTVDPRYSFSSKSPLLDYSLLKKTTILSLNCYGDDFSQEHFDAMKRVFNFCDKVSDLRLSFIKTDCDEGDVWYFYSDPWWATNKIKSLTLEFQGDYDDDPIIQMITKALANMTEIKSLSISLAGTCITDQSVCALASYFMENALNISRFNLDLTGTAITDASIGGLCEHMNRVLTNIKDFRLELSCTEITDEGLGILVQHGIKLMNNLETFELYLNGTHITDQSADVLCGNANNLLKTKKLILDLRESDITEDSLVLFDQKIVSKMPFIEDLELKLTLSGICS